MAKQRHKMKFEADWGPEELSDYVENSLLVPTKYPPYQAIQIMKGFMKRWPNAIEIAKVAVEQAQCKWHGEYLDFDKFTKGWDAHFAAEIDTMIQKYRHAV